MELNEWLVLVVLILVAIGSLLFAAGSAGAGSTLGLVVAAAAVVGVFVRIKQYFDRIEAHHH